RRPGQWREELAHRGGPGSVTLRARAPVHRGHALAAERRARPLPAGGEVNLDTPRGPVLYLDGVTVSFDGFKALDGLSLYVDPGELRCIIGPNGAGKTTMMDVITGKTRPDSGTVWFGDKLNLLALSEPEIAQVGIGRKFQKPTVFEQLTVFENLDLALAGGKSFLNTVFAKRTAAQQKKIEEVLDIIGLADQHEFPGRILSHGQKQWLE